MVSDFVTIHLMADPGPLPLDMVLQLLPNLLLQHLAMVLLLPQSAELSMRISAQQSMKTNVKQSKIRSVMLPTDNNARQCQTPSVA